MESKLEVLFAPAEFASLQSHDLSQTICVVFDILRATSSMVTALANGAAAIFPVREIADAVRLRGSHPDALLAGERHGLRIVANQSGGIDFDLGNSPREFTRARVADREIIMTTTNGTRALQACRGAGRVFAGAWLNLDSLVNALNAKGQVGSPLLIVCAGTFEEAAYEDTLAAGGLCDKLWDLFDGEEIADSAQMARQLYLAAQSNLSEAHLHSRNARRLLGNPDLRDDVAFCLQRDTVDLVAGLRGDSVIRSV